MNIFVGRYCDYLYYTDRYVQKIKDKIIIINILIYNFNNDIEHIL